jgi:hypothetical protein
MVKILHFLPCVFYHNKKLKKNGMTYEYMVQHGQTSKIWFQVKEASHRRAHTVWNSNTGKSKQKVH